MMIQKPIRLIVLDIDGVMTGGEARTLDLPLLEMLGSINRSARHDKTLPAVTICSGRPAPYVEALMQGMDGFFPAVFENGAGLYVPEGYRFLQHPELNVDGRMRAVRDRLEETLVRENRAYFQPGKEYSLTIFANEPSDTPYLQRWVEAVLGPLKPDVELVYSISCLNILAKGSNKAKGIEFLGEKTGIDPIEMLGVGDSEVDYEFLRRVGYSAAPDNAVQAIKDIANYVSPYNAAEGVRDILRHFAVV